MEMDAEAYRSVRTDVISLARSRVDQLEQRAPATPEWRVRDVVAHIAGVCDDIVHGNLRDVATEPWTAAQVEKRRGWSVDELLADWEQHGAAVDAMIDQSPPGTFGQLLFDAWTHEQDIRGALTCPGGRESPAAELAFTWARDALDARDRGEERHGLMLVTDRDSTVVGVPPATATVRVSRFEVLRAMTGRRSVAQLRSYEWEGDAEPARLVLAPIFRPPTRDLLE